MPTGELAVSFQTDLNANSREMKILISTDNGQNWTVQDDPFDNEPSWWNSLMADTPRTLAAATSSAGKIRIIKGQLSGPGDLSFNASVGLEDLSLFALRWLESCSASNGWCGWADCNRDGFVNDQDLSLFSWFWLTATPL